VKVTDQTHEDEPEDVWYAPEVRPEYGDASVYVVNISIPAAALQQAWSQSNKPKLRTTFLYYKGGELFLSKEKVDGVKKKVFALIFHSKHRKLHRSCRETKHTTKRLLSSMYISYPGSQSVMCITKEESYFCQNRKLMG